MSQVPISGIHHVTLSVNDLDASVAWYQEVLGFLEVGRVGGALQKAKLARDGIALVLTSHGELAEPGPFTERRAGLDHLSFAVADRSALDAWVERLDAAGVPRGPVTAASSGDMVAFRDPDNIALEFYTLR